MAPAIYQSFTTAATVPRIKATFEPSGEKTASVSRDSSGGEVSGRVEELSSRSNAIQERAFLELLSGKASVLPSGDQDTPAHGGRGAVYSLRSVPPRAGIA